MDMWEFARNLADVYKRQVMGLGAGAYNDGTVYYPNLVIDLIDKVKLI